MSLIAVPGSDLFAERFGSGPPRVLALHGWGRRGSDFASALGEMDAIAVDLPGFGASPPPSSAIGAAGYADAIGPVLELFDSPPVAVGHSFGGRVAVMRQSRYRSFAGLVLVGAPLLRSGPRRKPPLAYRIGRTLRRFGLTSEESLERLRRRYGSADYVAAQGVMREVMVRVVNESYEAELARLDVPVCLLWGREDGEVPVGVAERVRQLVVAAGGSVDLEVVEGVGHNLPVRAPEALAAAVEAMLARAGR